MNNLHCPCICYSTHSNWFARVDNQSEADYENLIIELANHPQKLHGIRSKLQSNRLTKPLFDTKRYTRNFEAGLLQAYDLYFKGKQPRHIAVEDTN